MHALRLYQLSGLGFGLSLMLLWVARDLNAASATMFLIGVTSGGFTTLNGAMLMKHEGLDIERLKHIDSYATSPLFTDIERKALAYADAMTDTSQDVDDELFARMQRHYDDDTIAEMTMIIAWENASSRFNRAFRIPSQGFWKP